MNDTANVDRGDGETRPPDVRGPLDGMSARDAAVRLGLSERTIRRAIARGELVAVKQGASFRIAAADLERYAARAKRRGTPPPPDRRVDAPSAAPRLVALPAPAREAAVLPEPLSSFVGRRAEIAAVLELVGDPGVRLLTLTGPGGIGKTRLALQVAAAARDTFPDGAVYVELAPISRSELVAQAIGQALGLREGRNPTWEGQLQTFLRSKRLLLVLDNFEQVLDAAPLVAWLVREARGLTVLATSRAPLRLTGEREYAVPPLSLGRGGEPRPDSSDAIRLFVERARANNPTLALTDANAETIAEICRRLDGLPLAIELAAARSKVLSPAALLARLTHRLELLTGGPRDQPPRLRTMRDAVAWSHDLLTPEEQTLFRRLAVFAGGFVLGAAERVAGDDSSSPVLDVLASLVDKSLVQQQDVADEPRFALLETVREFGLEALAASGEEAAIRRAHAAWYLALAEDAEPELTGTVRAGWPGWGGSRPRTPTS